MPTLEDTARNAAVNSIVDLIDAGAGAGTLIFETSGDAEVATLTFSDPAYGAASSGTAQENAITSDTSATGGVVEHASIKDSNALKQLELTCTAPSGGGDIEITGGLTIGAGATVSCSDLSVTMPAT
jgi:hypothetical protein